MELGIVFFCCDDNWFYIFLLFVLLVVGMVDSYGVIYNVFVWLEYFLFVEMVCIGRFVCLLDFIKIVDECDLWYDVVCCLVYCLMVMSVCDCELVGVNFYLKVWVLLIEIWVYL